MTKVALQDSKSYSETYMAPIDFETEIGPLPLQGELPAGLCGTLVRNGPNPVMPDPQAHWFAGDGMLHAFAIGDGAVRYRNRWVHTERWKAAVEGRERLPGFQQTPAGDKLQIEDDGTANVNVIGHAGRVLALNGGYLPVAMTLPSLQTLGRLDFDGAVSGCFTAHPKIDPRTGELVFFACGTPTPLSNGMSYGTISAEGRVTRFERFESPFAAVVHDFMITEHHIMFPLTPLTTSLERALKGGPPCAWEPEYGARVGVMPRDGSTADIVWRRGPICFMWHVMNAWETGDSLFADVMEFDAPPLFPRPDGTPASEPDRPARLVRWEIDLANPDSEFTRTVLDDTPGEFPRIDERFVGVPYRHGWFALCPENPLVGEGLVHFDHATGKRDIYELPAIDRVSEGVFVPRSPDAEEGDGWLLAIIWRGSTDKSELAIFDALALSKGPVCTAALPHRMPASFHGSWFSK